MRRPKNPHGHPSSWRRNHGRRDNVQGAVIAKNENQQGIPTKSDDQRRPPAAIPTDDRGCQRDCIGRVGTVVETHRRPEAKMGIQSRDAINEPETHETGNHITDSGQPAPPGAAEPRRCDRQKRQRHVERIRHQIECAIPKGVWCHEPSGFITHRLRASSSHRPNGPGEPSPGMRPQACWATLRNSPPQTHSLNSSLHDSDEQKSRSPDFRPDSKVHHDRVRRERRPRVVEKTIESKACVDSENDKPDNVLASPVEHVTENPYCQDRQPCKINLQARQPAWKVWIVS